MVYISRTDRVELWLGRLGRQSVSGETVAEFCRREAISVASFYQWKRRLSPRVTEIRSGRTGCPQPPSLPPATSSFTELIINRASASQPQSVGAQATRGAQVNLPGGITISLGTQPEIVSLIVDRLVCHSQSTSHSQGAVSRC